jgi:hypothetical protein
MLAGRAQPEDVPGGCAEPANAEQAVLACSTALSAMLLLLLLVVLCAQAGFRAQPGR